MVLGIISLALIAFLVMERRTFCRYVCPLTSLIGTVGSSGMVTGFRTKNRGVCLTCPTQDCMRGRENGYGCPRVRWPGHAASHPFFRRGPGGPPPVTPPPVKFRGVNKPPRPHPRHPSGRVPRLGKGRMVQPPGGARRLAPRFFRASSRHPHHPQPASPVLHRDKHPPNAL